MEVDFKNGQKIALLEHQLRVKENELNSLLQITQAINSNISSNGLLKLYENILIKQIGIDRLAVFVYHDEWLCTNAFGVSAEEINSMIRGSLPAFKQIVHLSKTTHVLSKIFDVVVPVYHKDLPLAFTFLGGMQSDQNLTLDEKLNYIQTISNVIAVAIENKRLFRAHLRQKLLKSEMEMAGQMQTMLIPGKLPDDDRISIAGVYLPHQEVGGDYYDYIELNENECMICIGDISGKGVAAAILMANFQASVRNYSEQQASLSALIESLNTHVNDITGGEKYITFFLAKFNYITRELQYVNAGHNPAVLLCEGETKLLQEGCTILGMFEKLPYLHVQSLKLDKEFIIFFYTDGLTDIENEMKQPIDLQDIISLINRHRNLSPLQLNQLIVDYLIEFKGSRLINDDVSILTSKIF